MSRYYAGHFLSYDFHQNLITRAAFVAKIFSRCYSIVKIIVRVKIVFADFIIGQNIVFASLAFARSKSGNCRKGKSIK